MRGIEDIARYFLIAVWHPSRTCGIGGAVDHKLRVAGQGGCAWPMRIMPNTVSGSTNAARIMIGERAAEMIGRDHEVKPAKFVRDSVTRELLRASAGAS